MKVTIDDALIEYLVSSTVINRDKTVHPLQIKRFLFEKDRIYSILDPNDRDAAFSKLYLKWFNEWDLERIFQCAILHFPILKKELSILAFRKVKRASQEGSDLFINPQGEKHGVIGLTDANMRVQESFTKFLNHELMHLNDMVDPKFDYSTQFLTPYANNQTLLIRRYQVLWDVSIDGRLTQMGLGILNTKEFRRGVFERAFSFLLPERRERLFNEIWSTTLTHHDLVNHLTRMDHSTESDESTIPGSPCPLCNSPTFDWVEVDELSAIRSLVQKEFPHFDSRKICLRCYECYEQYSFTHPSTLFREQNTTSS